MAKNTGAGYRVGSVKDRTQSINPFTGTAQKRDTTTGRFTTVKKSEGPYKGIAREPDGRRY